MNQDLIAIKKHYGEKMMHLCRDLFPTLLEEPGLLPKLMLEHFESNHFLYEDLDVYAKTTDFKNYIYLLSEKKVEQQKVEEKTPQELLDEAGYVLYECKNEEEIQSFKKYWKESEELCTFDGRRLERCHVFFAIKKDIDNIKREDFSKPERQNLYGTSAISIQFTKDPNHTLSIKNRYNHRVPNSDATFSNNLDNIIKGLTYSFTNHYGLKQNNTGEFEIDGYVQASDGKYYKYNYEVNNVYFCPDNIVIDNFEVKRLPKDRYLLIDTFVIDFQKKSIADYFAFVEGRTNLFSTELTYQKSFQLFEIDRITVTKKDNIKEIEIFDDNNELFFRIGINSRNIIKSFYSDKIIEIGDFFLEDNKELDEIDLPNVEIIGGEFLENNKLLKKISLPKLKSVKNSFLGENENIEEIDLPNLEIAGGNFMSNNNSLEKASLQSLIIAQNDFLSSVLSIKEISLPNLKTVGDTFLQSAINLERIYVPKLKTVGHECLEKNINLKELDAPELVTIGMSFLSSNEDLEYINLPVLLEVKHWFLNSNKKLKEINLPSASVSSIMCTRISNVRDRIIQNNKVKRLSYN